MDRSAVDPQHAVRRCLRRAKEGFVQNLLHPRGEIGAQSDRANEIAGRGMDLDGHLLRRTVESREHALERLGERGGRVLTARRLSDPPAGPRGTDAYLADAAR